MQNAMEANVYQMTKVSLAIVEKWAPLEIFVKFAIFNANPRVASHLGPQIVNLRRVVSPLGPQIVNPWVASPMGL